MFSAHGVDLLDICAGGRLDSSVRGWLGERADAMMNNVSVAARGFFEQSQSMYQMISADAAIQALRNMTVKVENAWQSNQITYLTDTSQLQTAPMVQIRYIMANPRLRQHYLNQEVMGYGEHYENLHGDRVGEQHYDYRRVMDGIGVINDDSWSFKQYIEHIGEDQELTLFQKVDMLRTWNTVNDALDKWDEDPTSQEGLKLG